LTKLTLVDFKESVGDDYNDYFLNGVFDCDDFVAALQNTDRLRA